MISRILVALDGSEPSKHGLDYAVKFAEGWNAELTIISVVPNVIFHMFHHDLYSEISIIKELPEHQERMRTIFQNVLTEAEEKIRREHPDVKVVTRLEEGRPSATIVEVAESDGVDLIVMGSQELRGIKGWILGSTSHRVANSCTMPVFIVK